MKLKHKIMMAQAPLAFFLMIVGVLCVLTLLDLTDAAESPYLDRMMELVKNQNERPLDLVLEVTKWVVTSIILAFTFGMFASTWLTTLLLRPLEGLSQVARRIADGDLTARAQIKGADELKKLAADFNEMANHLQEYRASSLGELLQSQLAMQAAIDSLPDPVIVLDLKGELRHVNQAAINIFLVEPFHEIFPFSNTPEPILEAIGSLKNHVLGGKGPLVAKSVSEAISVHKNGQEPQLYLPRAYPVYEEGAGVIAVTMIFQDVTSLRLVSQEKSAQLQMIIHEFKVPLDAIHMSIHALIQGTLGDMTSEQMDLLYPAREACERLQDMVGDLTELSKIEAKSDLLVFEEAALSPLINTSLYAFSSLLELKGVLVETEISPLLPKLKIDKDRIQAALDHLIGLASKNVDDGRVLKILAIPLEEAVRVDIFYQGVRLHDDHLKIFAENDTDIADFSEAGADIEMYLSREIIAQHGGDMNIHILSEDLIQIWFTLPLK